MTVVALFASGDCFENKAMKRFELCDYAIRFHNALGLLELRNSEFVAIEFTRYE